MDIVDGLIGRFAAASFGKVTVVVDLEDHLDDPRVPAFLTGLIADPFEHDLARIECMKILRLTPPPAGAAREAAGRAIAAVLTEDDELLRQFAAMSLGPYLGNDAVFTALENSVLHDEDLAVRHNAVAALAESGPSPRNARLLRRLAADPDLGSAAGRVLRAWSHGAAG